MSFNISILWKRIGTIQLSHFFRFLVNIFNHKRHGCIIFFKSLVIKGVSEKKLRGNERTFKGGGCNQIYLSQILLLGFSKEFKDLVWSSSSSSSRPM